MSGGSRGRRSRRRWNSAGLGRGLGVGSLRCCGDFSREVEKKEREGEGEREEGEDGDDGTLEVF